MKNVLLGINSAAIEMERNTEIEENNLYVFNAIPHSYSYTYTYPDITKRT